ncbi:hypothetical protein DVA43_07015 [Leclercia sp. W6]|nr:DNA polymerase III subunit theta [Leclercia sp. W6]AXF59310.1 hypothetical protein DVA43_07015 [Leclercia sp. W6]
MINHNIAEKPQEDFDKGNIDLAASVVAYKERLNMPVIVEALVRENLPELCQSKQIAPGL